MKTRVTGVGTLRRDTKDHWVAEYMLQYSEDDIAWHDYHENGYIKVRSFVSPKVSALWELKVLTVE